MPHKGNTEATCKACGESFLTSAHFVKRGWGIFCSRACKNALLHPIEYTAGGDARIPLCRRDGSISGYVLINAADVAWASQYRWHLTDKGYAARNVWVGRKHHMVPMHRELLGLSKGDGLEVDHRNRNRCDNRRSNLRAVTSDDQHHNRSSYAGSSSRFRGVSWHKVTQKWRARVQVYGKTHYLGLFDSEEEAGAAIRAARLDVMPFALD